MTTKAMLKCKRARVEKCKGFKSDPIESYGKWAYWCCNERNPSWRNSKCYCKRVNELGIQAFGSREETKKWMGQTVHSLEGQRPIDLIWDEQGAHRVEHVLLAIIGGAY